VRPATIVPARFGLERRRRAVHHHPPTPTPLGIGKSQQLLILTIPLSAHLHPPIAQMRPHHLDTPQPAHCSIIPIAARITAEIAHIAIKNTDNPRE
jgi:hypothetical protein